MRAALRVDMYGHVQGHAHDIELSPVRVDMKGCDSVFARMQALSHGAQAHEFTQGGTRTGAQARRRAGAQVACTHARANTRTHSTGHGDRVRAVGHAERDAEGAVVLCGLARVGVRVCAAHVHACLFMDNLLEHG